jgi:2,3-bisphosphoglycerate-independent phosphoglycerate mutase
MKMVKVEDPTNLAEKAKIFKRELKEGTVVYAHIKGPDEFGHDGDAMGKKANIELIDREFFGPVEDVLEGDPTLAVSCDHATPCVLKMHSADPVPLLLTSGQPRSVEDKACRFTEKEAKRGPMGTLIGKDVLNTVLSSA